MKCKCDWVRSEIRENSSITSGQWESRVGYLGRCAWFGGTTQACVQPNVPKDWVTGCANGPLSTQERCLCELTTKASNSKDSIFKSICTDLECFLLKQISVFKLLPTLSLLELQSLNGICWWDVMQIFASSWDSKDTHGAAHNWDQIPKLCDFFP